MVRLGVYLVVILVSAYQSDGGDGYASPQAEQLLRPAQNDEESSSLLDKGGSQQELVRNSRDYGNKKKKNNYSKGYRNKYRLDEVKKQDEHWSNRDSSDNYKLYNNGDTAYHLQHGPHNNHQKLQQSDYNSYNEPQDVGNEETKENVPMVNNNGHEKEGFVTPPTFYQVTPTGAKRRCLHGPPSPPQKDPQHHHQRQTYLRPIVVL